MGNVARFAAAALACMACGGNSTTTVILPGGDAGSGADVTSGDTVSADTTATDANPDDSAAPDPCDGVNCSDNGACAVVSGKARCACEEGFELGPDPTTCVASCVPSCVDGACGDDGCGGSCGLCCPGTALPVAADGDCDGTLTAADCDDGDPGATTRATDGDCDGVLTAADCDDGDPAAGAKAADDDCDGVLGAVDCNDSDPNNCGPWCTVVDIDANEYATVWIGDRCWTQTNLTTTRFSDGTLIPHITDGAEWGGLSTPGWSYYNNDSGIGAVYGKLYNFYAASAGSLCPSGWRIPTAADWLAIGIVGGSGESGGGALKEAGLAHWNSTHPEAKNSTGFTALPGGLREAVGGAFANLGARGHWWTDDNGLVFLYTSDKTSKFNQDAKFGVSIRCVRE
jgi:uncharacterized protein (TIGR02145 family)